MLLGLGVSCVCSLSASWHFSKFDATSFGRELSVCQVLTFIQWEEMVIAPVTVILTVTADIMLTCMSR